MFCLHVSLCTMYVYGTLGGKKRAPDPLLAAMWILEIEPRLARKAVMLLTTQTITSTLVVYYFYVKLSWVQS